MPIYEFQCNDCNVKFEDLVSFKNADKCPETKCAKCESTNWTKLISAVKYSFSNPVGTDKWNSESSGHDYRFNHNIPKVKQEREMAKQLSHMGEDPYGDTSEKDFNLDTGIHDNDGDINLT